MKGVLIGSDFLVTDDGIKLLEIKMNNEMNKNLMLISES
jgi:hypothetical protein